MINIFLLFILVIMFGLLSTKEYYKGYKNNCPIKGTIEDINPNWSSCFRGYNIPYIFNVGTYVNDT